MWKLDKLYTTERDSKSKAAKMVLSLIPGYEYEEIQLDNIEELKINGFDFNEFPVFVSTRGESVVGYTPEIYSELKEVLMNER